LILGVELGGISGYYGGKPDTLIQRIIEFLMSIPTLPLWLALSAAIPSSWGPLARYFAITAILSVIGWTGMAREVRGKFLSLREEDFITAALLDGCSRPRIIFRHMVPSFSSHLIASLTMSVPGMILGETALSFLGLGLQSPAVSWGVLLQDAQNIRTIETAPWLMLPGLALFVTVLAMNFVGDGLRDAADPYKRPDPGASAGPGRTVSARAEQPAHRVPARGRGGERRRRREPDHPPGGDAGRGRRVRLREERDGPVDPAAGGPARQDRRWSGVGAQATGGRGGSHRTQVQLPRAAASPPACGPRPGPGRGP